MKNCPICNNRTGNDSKTEFCKVCQFELVVIPENADSNLKKYYAAKMEHQRLSYSEKKALEVDKKEIELKLSETELKLSESEATINKLVKQNSSIEKVNDTIKNELESKNAEIDRLKTFEKLSKDQRNELESLRKENELLISKQREIDDYEALKKEKQVYKDALQRISNPAFVSVTTQLNSLKH